MGLLIAAGALLFGFGAAYVASDDVRYLTRAGFEETEILLGRVPMNRIVADTSFPDEVRAAAELVVEARAYALALEMDPGETYTTFSDVGRDTLLLVLTASRRDCLCPETWRYPFVGRVPYRGYFDPAAGEAAARAYAARGFDVHLRPSAAFSTLGWFNDPLLSTAIDGGLGNASRHQALASVYIDGERLQDALRHLEASLALHDNADERARLAWLYWRLGRQQPAVDAFAAAVALSDEDSDYMRWVRAQFATDGHELPARSAAPPAASVQLDSPF